MTSVFQIRGICSMQYPATNCIGTIQILHRTGKSVGASWEMHVEDGTHLASAGRDYFMNKENASGEEVIPFVLFHIMNYRVDRKRIFTEVQVVNA